MILFAVAAILIYAWLLYPLLLWAFARRRQPTSLGFNEPVVLPFVSIIISAFNEASVIRERILNIKTIDYPKDRWCLLIGADGCTDSTVAVARKVIGDDTRIEIRVFSRRRGKVSVLRDLVHEAEKKHPEGLLVFTDANTEFRPDALRRLIAPFADESIGATCGRLLFRRSGEMTDEYPSEEELYWRIETRFKAYESILDSCLGANGAIYAVRTGLFWQRIPANIIVDDFVIGMKVREQGHRVRYVHDAVAIEALPKITDEWNRRIRIGYGDYQAIVLCWRCLTPSYGWFAWAFWSHKILRWFTPHLLMLLVTIAAFDMIKDGNPVAATILGLISTSLLAACIGRMLQKVRKTLLSGPLKACYRFLRLCDHFLTMHLALLIGFVRFSCGITATAWSRTPRRE
jgi:cellulose synthase/poly-beta-1,6-N-acetylglucosamine synthase-like glycosyltransferase